MNVVCFFETLLSAYESTGGQNSEEPHLREYLKSRIFIKMSH